MGQCSGVKAAIVSDVVVFVELENIDDSNGIETKQLFGYVCIGMVTSGRMPARDGLVVSFVGTPLVLRRVLVTPLVLRVPLGKPCDWRQGTPCSHYELIHTLSHL